MLNETLGSGLTGYAVASVTSNTYSAYNLVSSGPYILVSSIAILTLIIFTVWKPNMVKQIILGYTTLALTGVVLFVLYVMVKSIVPVSKAVAFEFLLPLGRWIVDNIIYILVSLPIAYFIGVKIEPTADQIINETK